MATQRKRKKTRRSGLRGLAEVTKKDFVAIASILCRHGVTSDVAGDFAAYFRSQNPRFDERRFVEATRKCR